MAQQTAQAVKKSLRDAKLAPLPLDSGPIIWGDTRASMTIVWY